MTAIRNIASNLARFLSWKAPAGVLQLTLGISLVIAVLCSSVIMLAYYARLNFLRIQTQNTLSDNAQSGLHYLMASRERVSFNDVQTVDLFGDGTDSVQLLRKPWGLFEIYDVVAVRGRHRHEKTAMITCKGGELANSALFVPENNSRIYLAGSALIIGDAYLPERGLTTGYVNGRNFEGKQLIDGKKLPSASQLPQFKPQLIELVQNIVDGAGPDEYRLNEITDLLKYKDFSFHGGKSNYFVSDTKIEIYDSLSGNLVVHSKQKIRVDATATLENIILIAPEIEIDAEFEGRVQCFASRIITVGEGSQLLYPSALALVGGLKDSTIVIQSNAIVEGQVIVSGNNGTAEAVLKIERGAVVHGMVYVNGTTDIEGTILGHLSTGSVRASVSTSLFSNHILDGKINAKERSPDMPGSLLWGGSDQLMIAQWIR